MDHWIFHTILLCIPLCLGRVQNQGNQVFEPTNLRIYSNDSLQQLILKWNVSDASEAYNSQIDIIFNIQVRLREENETIILNVNYDAVLNKSGQFQWGFISKVPLQCATHEARIRSKVVSSEIWSNWSNWVAADGPDALSDEENHIFPEGKVFERGSNITFCCIAKKNVYVSVYTFHRSLGFPELEQRRLLVTRMPESSLPSHFEFGCFFSDNHNLLRAANVFLTRQPDKPQTLSCETKDNINARCSWSPGYVEDIYYLEKVCPMEFILSDVSSGIIYCSTKFKNTCLFRMPSKYPYNVTLTYRNCFGEKHKQFRFDLRSTGQPDKPQNLSCETKDNINARCSWSPGYVEEIYHLEKVCPMEFILSDVSSGRIYCSTKFKNTCLFRMRYQYHYNVTLTYRNCFGEKHEQFRFDLRSTEKQLTSSQIRLTSPVKLMMMVMMMLFIQSYLTLGDSLGPFSLHLPILH